jgi:hypothetical protein
LEQGIYRTNIHHTLKRKSMRVEDLQDFIACYNPANRHERKETWHPEKNPEGRWRKFTHKEIIENIEAGLENFRNVAASLGFNFKPTIFFWQRHVRNRF